MYFKSLESKIRYSTSEAEPVAIVKNRPNSASLSLPQPSLMLVETEALALRNWEVIPYISSLGNSAVIV
jgi:hypothetical protein